MVIIFEREATELGPGAQAEYPMVVSMGSPGVVTVELTWEDDSGEAGHWRSHLTL